MSERFAAATEAPVEYVCEDCGKEFKAAGHLANHRKFKHEGGSIGGTSGGRRAGFSGNTLQAKIRDACLGTAAVAAISDQRLFIAVEGTVDSFAQSWANVAKASPTARRYIEAILVGGVWIPAVMSTVVMGVAVLMATDKLPPNLNGLGMYAVTQMTPESITKLQAMYQPAAPTTNGAVVNGPEEA